MKDSFAKQLEMAFNGKMKEPNICMKNVMM